MRIFFAIIVGVAIGYFIGFNDAQQHSKNIVERTVEKTGGGTRKAIEKDRERINESAR
jgi:hypothetical protein